uniref:Collagen alpha-1(III) chain-like n=1 Tax=Dermatophagoides pteronyssinus TaxID=6956 RepID=A0A6P6XQR8_DERPT|nr:collagen alpha-1(III) chain-like [Dermatophagoides pteronyssinus]
MHDVQRRFTVDQKLITNCPLHFPIKNDDTIPKDIQYTGYPTYGWDPSRTLNSICAERRCEPSPFGCRCDPTSQDPIVICCCCNQYRNNTQQRLCSQRSCVSGDCNCIGEKGSRGPPGIPGPVGPQGLTGHPGIEGAPGERGPKKKI